ncbi:phosphomannomutase [Bifidobacterium eulemuris]|uniref:phosphomannomutase n=1 Tax=Bifidobacterium eulemuris TaxID=1765219 RepID=A0A261GC15_9BIFI|nr:phosphomannomutase [Bifidobacterium eulemuris]
MVVVVPSWRDCDLDAVCARAKVFGFDLDNTLAKSKQPMTPPMARRFSTLTRLTPIALISGGSYAVVRHQVLDALDATARKTDLHVMPTSGTRYYRWNGEEWTLVYDHDLGEEDRAAIISSLERRAREQGAWERQVWGERIEDRGSQITFSALGQWAPVEAKRAWDPDDTRKRRLAQAVQADLPHMLVRTGGMTSVDVSEPGTDKSYAIASLADSLGIEPAQVAFIGDRMDPGGNDYPTALAGAMALRVRDPEDTLALCDELIRRLGG